MRVTNKLMADTVASDLSQSIQRLLKTQNMLATGKRINAPSDDPIGMGKVLNYRTTISTIDQYTRNINHGKSWLSATDSALGSVNELLTRAKEIATSQATVTATPQTRGIAAEEIRNIYDQIVQFANTTVENSHIFAGHKTDTAPFTRDAAYNVTYSGDGGDIPITVGEGVTLTINKTGGDAFTTGSNIFDTLRDLINGLENNDTAAISNQLTPLYDGITQIVGARAETGARLNRLETTENYFANFKLNISQRLSGVEDADIAQVTTDLATLQASYQAALASAANVLQPTLLDFLK
jgi:flagellar hook-associated protein 3 FlgL